MKTVFRGLFSQIEYNWSRKIFYVFLSHNYPLKHTDCSLANATMQIWYSSHQNVVEASTISILTQFLSSDWTRSTWHRLREAHERSLPNSEMTHTTSYQPFLKGLTILRHTIFDRRFCFSGRSKEFRGIMPCSNRLDAVCLLGKLEGRRRSMFDFI